MAATALRMVCLSWRGIAEAQRQRLKLCPFYREGFLFPFTFPISLYPAGDGLTLEGRKVFPTPSSPAHPTTVL